MNIPCDYKGEDINIGFSSKFLTEMLSVLGVEDITMKMSQPNRPGIVEPVDGLDENEHILMLSYASNWNVINFYKSQVKRQK